MITMSFSSFFFRRHLDRYNCIVLKIKYPFQYLISSCFNYIKHDFPFRLSLNMWNKRFAFFKRVEATQLTRAGEWKFSLPLPLSLYCHATLVCPQKIGHVRTGVVQGYSATFDISESDMIAAPRKLCQSFTTVTRACEQALIRAAKRVTN